jgi:hypothetical protein
MVSRGRLGVWAKRDGEKPRQHSLDAGQGGNDLAELSVLLGCLHSLHSLYLSLMHPFLFVVVVHHTCSRVCL